MAAVATDPTLGFLLMLAAGIALVVVVLVFIAIQVMGEHTQNSDRHHHA